MAGIESLIQALKKHPDYPKMGMIATHLGVVRQRSLNGRNVKGVDVSFDREVIQSIVRDIKKMPGIVEVIVEVREGKLKVGDEIMVVAVGGDTRQHVFPALINAVDRIKKKGSHKTELF